MDDNENPYSLPQNDLRVASNVGWMANRANGAGQSGTTKRSSTTFHDRESGTKKLKADIALPVKLGEHHNLNTLNLTSEQVVLQVTKEYSSAASLTKPFKTPFKLPLKVAPQEERHSDPAFDLSDNEAEIVDENIHPHSHPEQPLDEDIPGFYSCQSAISRVSDGKTTKS